MTDSRNHLVPKQVMRSDGVQTTVYVKPDDAQGSSLSQEVAQALANQPASASNNPAEGTPFVEGVTPQDIYNAEGGVMTLGIGGLAEDKLQYEEEYFGFVMARGIEKATGKPLEITLDDSCLNSTRPIHYDTRSRACGPEHSFDLEVNGQVFSSGWHVNGATNRFNSLDVLYSQYVDDSSLDSQSWDLYQDINQARRAAVARQEFQSAFGMTPTEMFERNADASHDLYNGMGNGEDYQSPDMPQWLTHDAESVMVGQPPMTKTDTYGYLETGEVIGFDELDDPEDFGEDAEHMAKVLGSFDVLQRCDGQDGDYRNFTIQFTDKELGDHIHFPIRVHDRHLGDVGEVTASVLKDHLYDVWQQDPYEHNEPSLSDFDYDFERYAQGYCQYENDLVLQDWFIGRVRLGELFDDM